MINFSILGYGYIGKVNHKAILNSEGAELVSIIDIDLPSDLGLKTYSTLECFLQEDTKTDVVIIATPNGLHYEHAMRCLKAGKNILIESPIGLNPEESKEILVEADLRNLRVFTSLQLRFSPVVQYIKKLIDNKALGKVFMINVQCYWNRNKNYYKLSDWRGSEEMDGGVLYSQFFHFIDVINYWFDEVKCIQSKKYNFSHQQYTEFADSGNIDFLADNAIGHMTYTTAVFNKSFESNISIIAEKGTVKIGDEFLNQMIYSDFKNICCSKNVSTDQENFHELVIQETVDALIRNNVSVIDGKEALKAIHFIKEIDVNLCNENLNTLKSNELSYT